MSSFSVIDRFAIFIVGISFSILLCTGCGESDATDHSISSIKDQTKIPKIIRGISPDSIKSDIHTLVSFKTRHTLSDTTSDSTGIGAARRWIYHKMKSYSKQSGGRLQVQYMGYLQQPRRRVDKPTRVVDVVAKLPGTQRQAKNRIYVVSGHYDTRVNDIMDDSSYAPGADDDGSGTAAVMEMARVMSQYKFDATLIFMAVAGEEQGLLGSTYFAKQVKKHHKNIAGMFNNDMVGQGKNRAGKEAKSVRVFTRGIPARDTLSRYDRILLRTGGQNDTPSRELGRFIHGIAHKYTPNFKVNLMYRTDRYLRGGDHLPFLKRGYTAVRFTEAYENFHHQHQYVRKENGIQYGDLPRFVSYHYITNVARVNTASLAMLANAPARPQDVRIVIHGLSNNTTIRWKANQEPDLKGYIVVWRSTHAPYWQHQKFVGDSTKVTLQVSKDDYLFGVRAVDTLGYYSPAVYPLPTFRR
jgi:hypothetical protein